MKVHGSCFCREIAFETEVDPSKTAVCHCTDCQKLTGTVYRHSVPTRLESFRLLKGKPKVFIKTAESSSHRAHSFCATCGTPVFAGAAEGPSTHYMLRIGSLDERASLPPMREIRCRSALPYANHVQTSVRAERD